MNGQQLLLATRSEGKLRELRPIFARSGYRVIDLDEAGVAPEEEDEGEVESADTFEGNALAKARYFFQRAHVPTVADDSGLEVSALGGRPGVFSKRWSGRSDVGGRALDEANNARLVSELVGTADRAARYVCVAAFVDGRDEIVRSGYVEGQILSEGRGTGGFGYDPYFFSTELGRTFGEASLEEKERVSHRGRAFRALVEALDERG
jgi:XTP/dITP diphosphohydrolase